MRMLGLYFAMDYWFMGEQRKQTTNLEEVRMAQSQIVRAIFFKKYFDSVQDNLPQTNLITVFEWFLSEVFREIINQVRTTGTSKLSKLVA